MRVFPSLLASVSALSLMVAGPALSQGFPASISVGALDGSNGTLFTSSDVAENVNWAGTVTGIGDINNDGIDDFAVALLDNSAAYVIFGATGGFGASQDASGRDGTNGFLIAGLTHDGNGNVAISAAGDLNGDGIDDMIVGSPGSSDSGRDYAGAAYVIFGHSGAFSGSIYPHNLTGANGFALYGVAADDNAGHAVANAGDFNKDGIDDVIIGADAAKGAKGASYVVFGHTGVYPASFELSSLNGTNGVTINGSIHGEWSGTSVASAGDVNGDGTDDVIVGAPLNDGTNSAAYLVFGAASWSAPTVDLSALTGTNGVKLKGRPGNTGAGLSVAGIGDINSDGIDDVVVGEPFLASAGGTAGVGTSNVVFGQTGFGASFELSSLDGTNGFGMPGVHENDIVGRAVSSAGDVNGDGISDLIVGAPLADPGGINNAGSAYVVFGIPNTETFAANVDLTLLNGANGFAINGAVAGTGQSVGRWVGNAGDVNNDGTSDLLVGGTNAALIYGLGTLPVGPTTLYSSVLPGARSSSMNGAVVTTFASVINAGTNRDENCSIVSDPPRPAALAIMHYHLTDANNVPVGAQDQKFAINPGQTISTVVEFQPAGPSGVQEIFPDFVCDHSSTDKIAGVNTMWLNVDAFPGADILSIGATPSGDGIITVPQNGISFMSVSAVNIGVGGASAQVEPDTNNVNLPLQLSICETDSLGACLAPLADKVTSTFTTDGEVHFYGVFVTDLGGSTIPLDPANKRVFLRFKGPGTYYSVTSAAVTVQ